MIRSWSGAARVPRGLAWALALAAVWLLLALVTPADRASAEPLPGDAGGAIAVDAAEDPLEAAALVDSSRASIPAPPPPPPSSPALPVPTVPPGAVAVPAADPLADEPSDPASVPGTLLPLEFEAVSLSPRPLAGSLRVGDAVSADHPSAPATSSARPPRSESMVEKPPTAASSAARAVTIEPLLRGAGFDGALPAAVAVSSAPASGAPGALAVVTSLDGLVLMLGRALDPIELDAALDRAREPDPSPD